MSNGHWVSFILFLFQMKLLMKKEAVESMILCVFCFKFWLMVLTPSMITSICTLLHKLVYLKLISLSQSRVLALLDDKNKLKKKCWKSTVHTTCSQQLIQDIASCWWKPKLVLEKKLRVHLLLNKQNLMKSVII